MSDRKIVIDLEAAKVASVKSTKKGMVITILDEKGEEYTRKYSDLPPSALKALNRLDAHCAKLSFIQPEEAKRLEAKGFTRSHIDGDGETIHLSCALQGIDGSVTGFSIPLVWGTTSYVGSGDLKKCVDDLIEEARNVMAGATSQLALPLFPKVTKTSIPGDLKDSDADGWNDGLKGEEEPDGPPNLDTKAESGEVSDKKPRKGAKAEAKVIPVDFGKSNEGEPNNAAVGG